MLCCTLWTRLSTRLFSHDNNVVTASFDRQHCYNLLTRLSNNDDSEQARQTGFSCSNNREQPLLLLQCWTCWNTNEQHCCNNNEQHCWNNNEQHCWNNNEQHCSAMITVWFNTCTCAIFSCVLVTTTNYQPHSHRITWWPYLEFIIKLCIFVRFYRRHQQNIHKKKYNNQKQKNSNNTGDLHAFSRRY